jgi:hypothetical protein
LHAQGLSGEIQYAQAGAYRCPTPSSGDSSGFARKLQRLAVYSLGTSSIELLKFRFVESHVLSFSW